jgi:hypothetical protein
MNGKIIPERFIEINLPAHIAAAVNNEPKKGEPKVVTMLRKAIVRV